MGPIFSLRWTIGTRIQWSKGWRCDASWIGVKIHSWHCRLVWLERDRQLGLALICQSLMTYALLPLISWHLARAAGTSTVPRSLYTIYYNFAHFQKSYQFIYLQNHIHSLFPKNLTRCVNKFVVNSEWHSQWTKLGFDLMTVHLWSKYSIDLL